MSDCTVRPRLLPCPFCGGEADISDEGIGTEPERYWAYCSNSACFVEGTAAYATEAEAIAAWNTRAELGSGECVMNRVKMFPEHKDCIFECWECSACKRTNDEHRPRFCPHCGAKVEVDA